MILRRAARARRSGAGAFLFFQGLGDLCNGCAGHFGGRDGRGKTQLAAGLGDDLGDLEGVQVEIAQKMILRLDGLRLQFLLAGNHLAEDIQSRRAGGRDVRFGNCGGGCEWRQDRLIFENRRGFAGIGEEFWFPVEREGTDQPIVKQRGVIDIRAQGEGRANGVQQAAKGFAADIDRYRGFVGQIARPFG